MPLCEIAAFPTAPGISITDTIESPEAKKIRELSESYVRAGYEVSDRLPFALTDHHHPDLVAKKDDHGFIIEVKSSAKRLPVERLDSIAKEVAQHEGWRFLLVTAEDVAGEELPGVDAPSMSWTDISAGIDQALRLFDGGEQSAAYVILWIAFERMLRLHVTHLNSPIERLSQSVVIRHLYSQGELSMEQFDSALACQSTRNRVVHGLESPELSESFRQLEQLVRELLAEWANAPAAT